jgi:hypothetical protein
MPQVAEGLRDIPRCLVYDLAERIRSDGQANKVVCQAEWKPVRPSGNIADLQAKHAVHVRTAPRVVAHERLEFELRIGGLQPGR